MMASRVTHLRDVHSFLDSGASRHTQSLFSLPEATCLPFSHLSLGGENTVKNEQPFVFSPVFAMERCWSVMLQSKVLPLADLAIGTTMRIK